MLLELGRCAMQRAEYARAETYLLQLQQLRGSREPEKVAKLLQQAKEQLGTASSQVSVIRILDSAEWDVALDGALLSDEAAGSHRHTDPGPHLVTCRHKTERLAFALPQLELMPGQTVELRCQPVIPENLQRPQGAPRPPENAESASVPAGSPSDLR
jgi:hypothetical protein